MTFSQYAGLAIVPTLARLVLAAAFVAAGYHKIFATSDFTAAEAKRLQELEVDVSGPSLEQPTVSAAPLIVPVSYRQTATDSASRSIQQAAQDALDQATQAASEVAEQVTTRAADAASAVQSEQQQPESLEAPPADDRTIVPVMPEPKPFKAAALHQVTLAVDRIGWPFPQWQAYLLAGTELVGGALLLVGLFSRIWGLGLAIAMGVAIYMTTAKTYWDLFPLQIAEPANMQTYSTFFLQASLLVLAFGVFLTGPGPLSLDRLLFGAPVKPAPAPPPPPPARPKFD